jgi:hypothetical protein
MTQQRMLLSQNGLLRKNISVGDDLRHRSEPPLRDYE